MRRTQASEEMLLDVERKRRYPKHDLDTWKTNGIKSGVLPGNGLSNKRMHGHRCDSLSKKSGKA